MKSLNEYLSTKNVETKEYDEPPVSFMKAQMNLRGHRTIHYRDAEHTYNMGKTNEIQKVNDIINEMDDNELVVLYVNVYERTECKDLLEFIENVANDRGYTMDKLKYH